MDRSAPRGSPAEEAFRAVYTDPVTVNGVPLTAADLGAHARVSNIWMVADELGALNAIDAVALVPGSRQAASADTASEAAAANRNKRRQLTPHSPTGQGPTS